MHKASRFVIARALCARGNLGKALPICTDRRANARAEARAAKNWDLADAIRDQLKDLGLTIEDTAAGTRIKSL